MKTKYIPAIIMLAAGLVACLVMIRSGVSNEEFIRILLIVLVLFLIIGWVVRFILEILLKKMEPQQETDEALAAEETEESLEELEIPTEEESEP
jgi:large-conductance mechanosensitive channel